MPDLKVNEVDVARLKIEPGEVLIISVDRVITEDVVKRIKAIFREAFECGGGTVPSMIVIDPQITIKIAKAEAH